MTNKDPFDWVTFDDNTIEEDLLNQSKKDKKIKEKWNFNLFRSVKQIILEYPIIIIIIIIAILAYVWLGIMEVKVNDFVTK